MRERRKIARHLEVERVNDKPTGRYHASVVVAIEAGPFESRRDAQLWLDRMESEHRR